MIRHILAFILLAAGVHAATIWYLPRLAMNTAMSRLEAQGAGLNTFIHVPPTDETSRRVVRPSPDLLYSVCLLDLSEGPVQIHVAGWGDYVSLSLFAGNTDNVFAVNESSGEGDIAVSVTNGDGADVDLGSERGIAIVRRLAPDAGRIAAADAARRSGDLCEPE
ncbi:DUF1254 domain-containing protein [Hyphobacterium sp. HN65]|uniref:DUF1254 domain-containing protein n=1 Tax=Hyphobacterium lacteum TaxID=3116575 RepID=A0ABU7LQU9_9PROT|nr:DUF1254 domain-containing protein [Hyphobacterium sp. HN65]MEE2525969.1 DUF1254 domain-containing protein [Hyphobacterium sp. HN65]